MRETEIELLSVLLFSKMPTKNSWGERIFKAPLVSLVLNERGEEFPSFACQFFKCSITKTDFSLFF